MDFSIFIFSALWSAGGEELPRMSEQESSRARKQNVADLGIQTVYILETTKAKACFGRL
jgi:hypothetical protein